jgi:hypothetical protein
MGMLEIYLEKFRLRPIPYQQVRPFGYGDLALSAVEGLDARSARLEETVLEVLTTRVQQLVQEARFFITEERQPPGGGGGMWHLLSLKSRGRSLSVCEWTIPVSSYTLI